MMVNGSFDLSVLPVSTEGGIRAKGAPVADHPREFLRR